METRTNHGAKIALPEKARRRFTVFGLPFLFGTGPAPALPDEWELIQRENEFMRCLDTSGKQHYLSDQFAYPIAVINGEERLERVAGIPLQPSPEYRPSGSHDCNLWESEEGECWGSVELIDEIPSGDGTESPVYACKAHAEFFSWCCGNAAARKYIPPTSEL